MSNAHPCRFRHAVTAAVVATVICSIPLARADLISVDFGTGGSPVEAGFVQQSSTSVTHTTLAGDLTVAISDQQGNFDRGVTGGTNLDMYRDFYFKNGSVGGGTAGTMVLTLSGPALSANTDYNLTFYAYDSGDPVHATSFTGTSGTTGAVGPITNKGTGNPDTLDEYAGTGLFTSDGSGMLTFAITDSSDRPRINGFSISAAVPEPASIALLALGGLLLLRRRCR